MQFTPANAKFCEKLFLIPYYPRENHADVLEEIAAFVDRQDGLEWLIHEAVGTMKRWDGIPELRGLYCTRFKPADGREADCRLPGHTPADIESENRNALFHAERKLIEAAAEIPNAPSGLISPRAVKAKTMQPETNYRPPDWLRNLRD